MGVAPATGKRKKQRKTDRCVSFALVPHGKDHISWVWSLDHRKKKEAKKNVDVS